MSDTDSDTQRTVRKVVSFTPAEWRAIEDFRFENRIKSEAEAIRALSQRGLQSLAT